MPSRSAARCWWSWDFWLWQLLGLFGGWHAGFGSTLRRGSAGDGDSEMVAFAISYTMAVCLVIWGDARLCDHSGRLIRAMAGLLRALGFPAFHNTLQSV